MCCVPGFIPSKNFGYLLLCSAVDIQTVGLCVVTASYSVDSAKVRTLLTFFFHDIESVKQNNFDLMNAIIITIRISGSLYIHQFLIFLWQIYL